MEAENAGVLFSENTISQLHQILFSHYIILSVLHIIISSFDGLIYAIYCFIVFYLVICFFIISTDPVSLSKLILTEASLLVCPFRFLVFSLQIAILMEFDIPTCFGSRSNAVENRSDRSIFRPVSK